MEESDFPTPTFRVTEEIMTNHMIAFLIQYLAAVQNITDKRLLVYELMDAWKNKFSQSINRVKKHAAQVYAEQENDYEDVWDIIIDISSIHIDSQAEEFSEQMRETILENLKIG